MTLGELINTLTNLPYSPEALVVIQGESLPPHSIIDIKAERHDDGDGSTTVWINVEEM